MARIGNAERSRLFGQPGDRSYLRTVETPWGIRVPVHEKIVGVFSEACRRAGRVAWNPRRIDSFNPRPIRGSSVWSIHSWALAFDFFATPPGVPPPGGVWTPANGVPAEFAKCFTDLGFTWGATFTRCDVPHIEWADRPPTTIPQEDDVTPEELRLIGVKIEQETDKQGDRLWQRGADDRKHVNSRLDKIESTLDEILARLPNT